MTVNAAHSRMPSIEHRVAAAQLGVDPLNSCRGELHRLSMGSVDVCHAPRFGAAHEAIRDEQAFGQTEVDQGLKPMDVVGVGVVGVTGRLGGRDLSTQRSGPLRPSEVAGLREADGQRKRMRLPRLVEDRALLVARKRG